MFVLFAIFSLSIFSYSNAYAQTSGISPNLAVKVTGFNENIVGLSYQTAFLSNGTFIGNKIWALTTNGTAGSTANNWLYDINPNTFTISAKYNVTLFVGDQATDLECSNLACYVSTWRGTLGSISRVISVLPSTGGIANDCSVGTGAVRAMDIRQSVIGTFVAVNLITFFQPNSANNYQISIVNPADCSQLNTTQQTQTSMNTSNFDIADLSNNTVNPNTNRDEIVSWASSVPSHRVQKYTLATNTWGSQSATFGTSGIASNLGYDKDNYSSNRLVWIGDNDGDMFAIDMTTNTPTEDYNITSASLGLGANKIIDFLALPDLGVFVVRSSGVSATLGFYDYTPSTGAISTASPVFVGYIPATNQVANTNAKMIYVESEEIIIVPENNNSRALSIVSLNVPAPPDPTPPFVAPTKTIDEAVGVLLCQMGVITDCDSNGNPTNTDIETNGVGLFMTLILIIISYAFLVIIHFGAQRLLRKSNVQVMDAITINPMLLVIMLVIDIGISFYLNWLADTVFYSIVAVIVGFASFGIYRHVKGGNGE